MTGTTKINGKSCVFDKTISADIIIKWIEEYNNTIYFFTNESSKIITIELAFKLDYFNSSSAKYLIDIINAFNKIKTSNKNVELVINWYYDKDDEDILDAGKEFMTITNAKISFVEM